MASRTTPMIAPSPSSRVLNRLLSGFRWGTPSIRTSCLKVACCERFSTITKSPDLAFMAGSTTTIVPGGNEFAPRPRMLSP
jgi:hypothetical protein